jgi:uncharacterized protein
MQACIYAIITTLLSIALCAQPELSGRVIDNASILSLSERQELQDLLKKHEQTTTNQIVIVTLPSLGDKSIEETALELGRMWGIGTKKNNNGIMFIIAPNDRQIRIEVGYGLEAILTDAQSKIIIERSILPYFRRGEYYQGIAEGTKAIISKLQADELPQPEQEQEQAEDENYIALFIFILFVFIIISFLGRGRRRGPPPPFYSGRDGDFPSSGSGGFSGGGGSFGGGGASGKWSKSDVI